MSDTVPSTAPVGGSEAALFAAGAARLAPLAPAPQATQAPAATPQQATVPTAPAAQSTPQPEQDTADATLPVQEAGEPEAVDPAQPEDPDPVLFTMDDGTPVRTSEAKRGYLRQQDYSAKTTLLAQGRDQLVQILNEGVAARDMAAKLIEQHLPQVDPQLEFSDPGLWAAQNYRRNAVLGQLAELRAQNSVTREQIEQHDVAYARAEIPRALGHWSDRATELREQELARGYVQADGYPEQTLAKIRSDPWLIRMAVAAAKHHQSLKGASKGGQATAQRVLAPPSPAITVAQTRPAPAGTARARQQVNGQQRGGEAVPTGPGRGLRTRFDLGAGRLRALPGPQRG